MVRHAISPSTVPNSHITVTISQVPVPIPIPQLLYRQDFFCSSAGKNSVRDIRQIMISRSKHLFPAPKCSGRVCQNYRTPDGGETTLSGPQVVLWKADGGGNTPLRPQVPCRSAFWGRNDGFLPRFFFARMIDSCRRGLPCGHSAGHLGRKGVSGAVCVPC